MRAVATNHGPITTGPVDLLQARLEISEGVRVAIQKSGDSQLVTEAAFEAFWMMYPRKTSKGYARKCFATAAKKVHYEEILIALKSQIEGGSFGDDKHWMPHPSTWLNGERWEDEIIPRTRIPLRNGAAELLARDWMAPPVIDAPAVDLIEGPAHG